MQLLAILREIQRVKGWNQSQLGNALRVDQSTISRWYGKGQRPDLDQRDRILALAQSLGVVDNSTQSSDFSVPIVGYVGAGGHILFGEGQGPFGEARMPPEGAKATTVAVLVRGDSMSGQLEDGWTVYYETRKEPPTPDLYGKLCVIGLPDGEVYIKKLLPGSQPGTFHLLSANAGPLLDQKILWAARVTWIAPV
jgi:phage repressor protein C with HTH and peptisase S24 domain